MMTRDFMFADPPFRGLLSDVKLDSVEAVLRCRGDHLAAWSRTSDTIRYAIKEADTTVFIKRYHYPRWRQRFRGMLRGTFFEAVAGAQRVSCAGGDAAARHQRRSADRLWRAPGSAFCAELFSHH